MAGLAACVAVSRLNATDAIVIAIASRAAPRRSLRFPRRFRRARRMLQPAVAIQARCWWRPSAAASRFAAMRPVRGGCRPWPYDLKRHRMISVGGRLDADAHIGASGHRSFPRRSGIREDRREPCGVAGVNVLASRSAASNSAGHGASAAGILQGDRRRHRMKLDEAALGIEEQLMHPREQSSEGRARDAACRGRRRERLRAGSIPEDQRRRTADPKVGPPRRRTVRLRPLDVLAVELEPHRPIGDVAP